MTEIVMNRRALMVGAAAVVGAAAIPASPPVDWITFERGQVWGQLWCFVYDVAGNVLRSEKVIVTKIASPEDCSVYLKAEDGSPIDCGRGNQPSRISLCRDGHELFYDDKIKPVMGPEDTFLITGIEVRL